MPKIANNPDDFIPGDATRVNQLEVNYRWLIARMDEIHAALCPDKNGTWQERARQAAEAAVKVQVDIDRLRSENARLRVLLDAALDDHLESRMGACPEDCWCWAAEKLLEETK